MHGCASADAPVHATSETATANLNMPHLPAHFRWHTQQRVGGRDAGIAFAPTFTASSAMAGVSSGRLKTSTTSIGSPKSESESKSWSAGLSVPDRTGYDEASPQA